MDALLLIDAAPDQFSPAPPQSLVDLVDRARGVGGVIVHVAAEAAGEDAAPAVSESGEAGAADNEAEAAEAAAPRIESALGTREDELVLVSAVPDAFEGVPDLAEGLDDLGVDRLILAGSNARGGLLQSAYAALAIGFELLVVADGVTDGAAGADGGAAEAEGDGDWLADLDVSGAVVQQAANVWLKM